MDQNDQNNRGNDSKKRKYEHYFYEYKMLSKKIKSNVDDKI